jgi:exosortase
LEKVEKTIPLVGKLSPISVRAVPWRRVGFLGLLFLVILGGIYAPAIPELLSDWWNDPNYSHGFLVPLFSGFFVWQRREALKILVPQGHWLGLPVLLAGIGTLILGDIGAEYFLTRSSFIVIVAGLVLFHLGVEIFRLLLFPLAFLFFMVPLPAIVFNAIAFPLQGLAAQNAAWTLDLLGVPVLRDGNVIHLSLISLGVTEACSGIRSLVSLLALAVAWAYLSLSGGWSRVLLVLSAVPITVIANAGRVVMTGLIGQWFGLKYAQGFFHSFSGWIIFLVAFLGLWGVNSFLQLFFTRRYKEAA